MDFMFKHNEGLIYRLYFTTEGLCLSPFKKYSVVIIFGICVNWCEGGTSGLDLKIPVAAEIHDYKVIANLNCWDLLTILESEFNHTDELLEMCYKNEFSGDKIHE